MFCKYCGKEIAGDSLFCQFCGRVLNKEHTFTLATKINILYGLWAIANLYLLIGNKSQAAYKYFFPLGPKYYYEENTYFDKDYYDFSEFIFYTFILPLIVYIIYRRNQLKIDNFIHKLFNKEKRKQ